MATIVETATTIAGLLNRALTLVQQIRLVRDRVKDNSKALQDVWEQLDSTSETLELVRSEPRLHTPGVRDEVSAITTIIEELGGFFHALQIEQGKSKFKQLGHAIKSGDKDDKKLSGILGRLSGATQKLSLRISVAHVSLTGNAHDGFQTTQRVVINIDESVRGALGMQLQIAELLQTRQLNDVEAVGLDEEAVQVSGLRHDHSEGRREPADDGAAGDAEETGNLNWRNNETGDDPKIMAGNLGLDESEKAAVVKASITGNKFGNGLRVMVGTVGKEASQSFSENFWK